MKKSNAAIATFLDTKYIPLESKFKVIIAVFALLLPVVLFFFFLYQPNLKKVKSLTSQKQTLSTELQNVKKRARNLPQLARELAEAKRVFAEKAVLLPKEKEIPKLLKDISALGTNAGLDFLTFKPLPDVPKDFYAEIPVTINVRGPYHNMGFFFDQVSKLDRIVSVTNVKMSSPKKEAGEMLLKSDCKLVTYRFTNVELPKPKNK